MQRESLKSVFRASQHPATLVPLGLRSTGHYIVPPHWHDGVRVKNFLQIFWGCRGTGSIVIQGTERALPPEHVARLAMHYDSMCRRDTDWQERFKGYTKVCGFLLRPESLGRLRKRGLHEPATGEARSGRELRG